MGQDKTKPARQTWREWVSGANSDPEYPPLLTRREVLATAEQLGVTPPVDERTLRYWEAEGIVPRPTLDYTSRGERAKYPWWMPDLLWHVRRYQHMGMSTQQLRARIPAEARLLSYKSFIDKPFPRPHPQDPPSYETVVERAMREIFPKLGLHFAPKSRVEVREKGGGPITMEFPTQLLGVLDQVLQELTEAASYSSGLAVAEINVEFVTVDGERLSLPRPHNQGAAPAGDSEQEQTTVSSADGLPPEGGY